MKHEDVENVIDMMHSLVAHLVEALYLPGIHNSYQTQQLVNKIHSDIQLRSAFLGDD